MKTPIDRTVATKPLTSNYRVNLYRDGKLCEMVVVRASLCTDCAVLHVIRRQHCNDAATAVVAAQHSDCVVVGEG